MYIELIVLRVTVGIIFYLYYYFGINFMLEDRFWIEKKCVKMWGVWDANPRSPGWKVKIKVVSYSFTCEIEDAKSTYKLWFQLRYCGDICVNWLIMGEEWCVKFNLKKVG